MCNHLIRVTRSTTELQGQTVVFEISNLIHNQQREFFNASGPPSVSRPPFLERSQNIICRLHFGCLSSGITGTRKLAWLASCSSSPRKTTSYTRCQSPIFD